MSLGIRYETAPPKPEDYNRLRRDAGWPEMDPETVRRCLPSSSFAICALENEMVVGTGRVVGDGGLCFYIQDVIVARSHQGRGIGEAIMDAILDFIEEKAVQNTYVGLMSAMGKEGFYHRFGFTTRPTDTLGAGMTRVWGVEG